MLSGCIVVAGGLTFIEAGGFALLGNSLFATIDSFSLSPSRTHSLDRSPFLSFFLGSFSFVRCTAARQSVNRCSDDGRDGGASEHTAPS